MDPEEELATPEARAMAPSVAGANWDGRIAVNPRTGERLVYRINSNGRGRFVALNSGSASPAARETLQNEQARLNVLRRLAPLAQEFLRINREEPSGGYWQRQGGWFPDWPRWAMSDEAANNLARMDGLTAASVRANIQPGTSGASNSVFEQQVLRDMFPNTNTPGPANYDRTLDVLVDAEITAQRVRAMEEWLTRQPTLDGFTSEWSAREPNLRTTLNQQMRQRLRGAGGDQTAQQPAAARRVRLRPE